MTTNTPAQYEAAIQESERVAAADEYFKARTWIMDTNDNRRIFEAGFDRAYALLSKLRAPVADETITHEIRFSDDQLMAIATAAWGVHSEEAYSPDGLLMACVAVQDALLSKLRAPVADDVQAMLKDPATVHVNMCRGVIAPITFDMLAHVLGDEATAAWLESRRASAPVADERAAESHFEDELERAYWEMDARIKGLGRHKGRPQPDRDAFKWAVRGMRPMPPKPVPERICICCDVPRNNCDCEREPAALASAPVADTFQGRVQPWMMDCFGPTISADRQERNHRFIEEALELIQACGATASEAHQLVDYVFNRPLGEPRQEVGGVMVTLAALCLANGLDMHQAGDIELTRISAPAIRDKIRAKQANKPKHSPLPESAPVAGEAQRLYSLGEVPNPMVEALRAGIEGECNGLDLSDQKARLILASMLNRGEIYAAPQASEAQCSCPSGDGSLRHPCAVHGGSEAVRGQALAALQSAQRFIRNGIEFGYVRMPDADTPDPAHRTPGLIDAAIRALSAQPGAQKNGGSDAE